MNYYTSEQIKKLKELDVIRHFDTVLDSEFKRGTTSIQDNAVADIYDETTGGKVARNFGCKSCVYNLYRNAGELYRKSVEFQKKENMRKAREAKQNKKNNVEISQSDSKHIKPIVDNGTEGTGEES